MFTYFSYGSNINLNAIKAKGVNPISSTIGVLKGWHLRFNVQHWFNHEGGMGNIEISSDKNKIVEGVVHECRDEALSSLDKLEAYGIGYDRIKVRVMTDEGDVEAFTYVGLPAYINDQCLPTQRYLNIIVKGAEAAGLSKAYIKGLKGNKIFNVPVQPQYKKSLKGLKLYDKKSLAKNRYFTALNGYVFDMSQCRKKLICLHDIFGGKDMTLFHLKRLDTSDGSETLSDIKRGNISKEGKVYLNNYLHEYEKEFTCIGRYELE